MRIDVSPDFNAIQPSRVVVQHGEQLELRVYFHRASDDWSKSYDPGLAVVFGAKGKDDYSGDTFLLYCDTFEWDGAAYVGSLGVNTEALADLIGEAKSVTLSAEFQFSDASIVYKSRLFEVQVYNDVIKGNESVSNPVPDYLLRNEVTAVVQQQVAEAIASMKSDLEALKTAAAGSATAAAASASKAEDSAARAASSLSYVNQARNEAEAAADVAKSAASNLPGLVSRAEAAASSAGLAASKALGAADQAVAASEAAQGAEGFAVQAAASASAAAASASAAASDAAAASSDASKASDALRRVQAFEGSAAGFADEAQKWAEAANSEASRAAKEADRAEEAAANAEVPPNVVTTDQYGGIRVKYVKFYDFNDNDAGFVGFPQWSGGSIYLNRNGQADSATYSPGLGLELNSVGYAVFNGGFFEDLKMNGHKIISLGDGTDDTDAATVGQLSSGSLPDNVITTDNIGDYTIPASLNENGNRYISVPCVFSGNTHINGTLTFNATGKVAGDPKFQDDVTFSGYIRNNSGVYYSPGGTTIRLGNYFNENRPEDADYISTSGRIYGISVSGGLFSKYVDSNGNWSNANFSIETRTNVSGTLEANRIENLSGVYYTTFGTKVIIGDNIKPESAYFQLDTSHSNRNISYYFKHADDDAYTGPANLSNILLDNATVSNSIDMNGGKILNLAAPTANTDAANKAYVDANAGGGGDVDWSNVQLDSRGLSIVAEGGMPLLSYRPTYGLGIGVLVGSTSALSFTEQIVLRAHSARIENWSGAAYFEYTPGDSGPGMLVIGNSDHTVADISLEGANVSVNGNPMV